ncbi:MAG: acetate--CoA ligase [Acidimicrobiia bacterium]|nr:acetate--CoA ligase [Acidimicrobiia bacterium]
MSDLPTGAAIEDYLLEERTFPPPADFVERALVSGSALHDEAAEDPEAFWARQATELLDWFEPWHTICDWQLPFAKWFVGGTLNVCHNAVDRHVASGHGEQVAFHWEGEPGDTRTITYADLHDEVQRAANALKSLGVVKGDRVAIYMPMVPELPIAMLACARIGAAHSVVFGGFSPDALADRIDDAACKVLVTADGGYRRGAPSMLKPNVDVAVGRTSTIEHVLVVKRVDEPVDWVEGRDHWWHELVAKAEPGCPCEPMGAEDLLYLLYTSGTTAKPKGIMHTTGGYLTQVAFTHRYVFDLHPDEDIYWCAADCGWVTGHSYIVYGPLTNRATSVMYEGTPDTPGKDRLWDIAERYGVTILYTAPTAIRTFMKWGTDLLAKHDLSKLRLLGSVGEPINPEAWMWYHEVIGGGRCPIVDTWWQTETGAIMISPLPGAMFTKPGSATKPLPGVAAEVVDKEGNPVPANEGGFLVVKRPWPSMMRTIYGDDERFKATYWSNYPGIYFTADGARRDADGYIWVMGRVDDVLNVSGHRLSTMEVESALVNHPQVAEAAVVGRPDDLKGESICCFVTLKAGVQASDDLKAAMKAHVVKEIGALARPDDIRFTDALPKTRSGKIMRRLLRDIAAGREGKGDTTTLEDFSILAKLREQDEG